MADPVEPKPHNQGVTARSSTAEAIGWGPLGELLGLLVGPLPFVRAPELLSDPAPDPGIFGPDSVTWRVAREPLLMLGSGRALLMQVAHPLVAQAVVDHSDYAVDPYGRLVRTVRWLSTVTFGTTAEAESASREVGVIHQRVTGVLDDANAGAMVPGGTRYAASDPALALWVHATIVESVLVAYEALVAPLARPDRDRFVEEWHPVAGLMGVPSSLLWSGDAALRAYVAGQINGGPVVPVPASRTAAAGVLHPPLPSSALRPVLGFAGLVSCGLLPDRLRAGLGVNWSRAHAATHASVCRGLRMAHQVMPRRMMPRRMRVSPLHDLAQARARGAGLSLKDGRRQSRR